MIWDNILSFFKGILKKPGVPFEGLKTKNSKSFLWKREQEELEKEFARRRGQELGRWLADQFIKQAQERVMQNIPNETKPPRILKGDRIAHGEDREVYTCLLSDLERAAVAPWRKGVIHEDEVIIVYQEDLEWQIL